MEKAQYSRSGRGWLNEHCSYTEHSRARERGLGALDRYKRVGVYRRTEVERQNGKRGETKVWSCKGGAKIGLGRSV